MFVLSKKKPQGYEDMIAGAQATPWSVIEADSGLGREQIEHAGKWLAASTATIACWAMGLTQHRNGVAVIQEVVNLLLMNGHIGRTGAGLCPVRGHSNVQGDRTVGIWESPTDSFIERMEEGLGFPLPKEHGYDVVRAIQAMLDGHVDVFFCMGGNFLSATPDTDATAKGFAKRWVDGPGVDETESLAPGYWQRRPLSYRAWAEQKLMSKRAAGSLSPVENSMGQVQRSRGALPPASPHLRSESWIVAKLADATLGTGIWIGHARGGLRPHPHVDGTLAAWFR